VVELYTPQWGGEDLQFPAITARPLSQGTNPNRMDTGFPEADALNQPVVSAPSEK